MWSNPNGQDWLWDGNLAPATLYPGKAGSVGDIVDFDKGFPTGSTTLDVAPPNPINKLEITGWFGTLTLNNDLYVTGDAAGDFQLTDGSDISMAAGTQLYLTNLPGINTWSKGSIQGGAGSQIYVIGTHLDISGNPVVLDPDMYIYQSATNSGSVTLSNMTRNLVLSGPANVITLSSGGSLNLSQEMFVAGQQNTMGGIVLGGRHVGSNVAVEVESGGLLKRNGEPSPGVPDQVTIGGAVYNDGGTVEITDGAMLRLTGMDLNGYSYWQGSDPGAVLEVSNPASNINAVGTYQIDAGTVEFNAPGTGSTADELDGGGLDFGNNFNTYLDMPIGSYGTIVVTGSVTLGALTHTTMYFTGADSTSPLLEVESGTLTLNGTLDLTASDAQMATQPLNLFQNNTANPSIAGSFTSISTNTTATTYHYWVDTSIPTDYYWELSMS